MTEKEKQAIAAAVVRTHQNELKHLREQPQPKPQPKASSNGRVH